MKINILGTEYQVVTDNDLIEDNLDGCCYPFLKELRVRPVENLGSRDSTAQEKQMIYNEVLRHEAIHAMFWESGIADWYDNEDLTDWIAKQFPKMAKIFEQLGCEG